MLCFKKKLLAGGSKDKTIKVLQVDTGKEIVTLTGHNDYVTSVAISLNGKFLASGSKDKTLKLWTLTTGELISTITHDAQIKTVAFSPNNRILATGCELGNINLFDTKF